MKLLNCAACCMGACSSKFVDTSSYVCASHNQWLSDYSPTRTAAIAWIAPLLRMGHCCVSWQRRERLVVLTLCGHGMHWCLGHIFKCGIIWCLQNFCSGERPAVCSLPYLCPAVLNSISWVSCIQSCVSVCLARATAVSSCQRGQRCCTLFVFQGASGYHPLFGVIQSGIAAAVV